MLSRRDLIGKAVVGAAAVVTVGAARTGIAATRPLVATTADAKDASHASDAPASVADAEPELEAHPYDAVITTPPPWALLAPLAVGSPVAHGWSLTDLTPVRDGAAVVTLQNARGHATRIHLCRNDGTPQGLVSTRRVDLVVMNQGYGDLPTDEHLGQAVAALARTVAANEATVADEVFAELLPHGERVQRFAVAVEGPAADGKLR
jgi:hypothetical protein